MILSFGGHQSTYYAGIIITIVFMLGVMPIPFKMSLSIVSIAYSVYLFPLLIFDRITNIYSFINNNAFLVATFMIALMWRFLSQRSLINELNLQYELNKEKRKLEQYSTHLEELVQERTKELTISEQRFRGLFDNANDGVVVLDKNGIIINMNNKFCEMHGFDKEALIGTHFKFLEAENNKEERLKRIINGESLVFETEHYKRDGSKILLEVSSKGIEIGGELYVQSLHRDITEKKAIQEQLLHSQKMESVGSLAGGIAHNFNNLLTAILGYAELLMEYSDLDNDSRQRVKSIESSARKAGVMVSKLLSFARRDTSEILPLNLNDVINDSVKLLEGVLDKRIGLKTTLNNNIPTIEADPGQLEQVIMNLMVNARDAMPDGGLITITTRTIEVRMDRFDMPTYIIPGRYVLLTISDTGSGIPKEIINRIFEPFFTTKEKGKGTGLGLATVYGIIKDHKGYITVQSEVDKGTTFDIYLPVSGKTAYKAMRPQQFSLSGHEKIFVVDDEEEVLKFIKDILETHGYRVLPAQNPFAAVDMFKKFSGEIDLVITDIVMPLMQGKELINNLKAIKPDIKIIAISGYNDEIITKDKTMINEFVKKPFEVNQFLSIVRHTLDTGVRDLPLY
jgi:two-component system cell cycle sensor histidine kinase/response regulator CckA